MFPDRKSYIAFCKAENRRWFEENKGRYYVTYLRNPVYKPYVIPYNGRVLDEGVKQSKGYPTAVMVAWRDGDELRVGWSAVKVAPLDVPVEPFVKAMGLRKAVSRFSKSGENMPLRVIGHMASFMMQANEELFEKPRRKVREAEIPAK